MKNLFAVFILVSLLLTACGGPNRTVVRAAPGKDVSLSGEWNDKDAQITADNIAKDILVRSWILNFVEEWEKNPTLIIGKISNDTDEHLDVNIFVKEIEKAMVNSGRVDLVASKRERKEIRDERMSQQSNASEDTAKRMAQEQGADFMLQGSIKSSIDQADGMRVNYYQVDFEIIDLETNRKVYLGNQKLKKQIQQKSYGW